MHWHHSASGRLLNFEANQKLVPKCWKHYKHMNIQRKYVIILTLCLCYYTELVTFRWTLVSIFFLSFSLTLFLSLYLSLFLVVLQNLSFERYQMVFTWHPRSLTGWTIIIYESQNERRKCILAPAQCTSMDQPFPQYKHIFLPNCLTLQYIKWN